MCEGSFLPSSFGPHQKHTEFESSLRSYPIKVRAQVLGADLGDTDPAPLLPNISEYDFGRREGQGHLNTFPAGVPSPRSSNGAVFGIVNTSLVKRHHPLPGDVPLIVYK